MSEELPPSDAWETPRPSEAESAGEHEAGDEVRATDADAWAKACAEDLAAEKARRRVEYGPPPGSAAEELLKFVDAVTDKLSSIRSPLLGSVAGPAAQQVVRQVVEQAKAAVEPVIERNPDVFDHLAAAGGELLAAYRSAVQAQEQRWTTRAADLRKDLDERRDGGEGAGPGQRIDLD